jgi:hypothetical protein
MKQTFDLNKMGLSPMNDEEMMVGTILLVHLESLVCRADPLDQAATPAHRSQEYPETLQPIARLPTCRSQAGPTRIRASALR